MEGYTGTLGNAIYHNRQKDFLKFHFHVEDNTKIISVMFSNYYFIKMLIKIVTF